MESESFVCPLIEETENKKQTNNIKHLSVERKLHPLWRGAGVRKNNRQQFTVEKKTE